VSIDLSAMVNETCDDQHSDYVDTAVIAISGVCAKFFFALVLLVFDTRFACFACFCLVIWCVRRALNSRRHPVDVQEQVFNELKRFEMIVDQSGDIIDTDMFDAFATRLKSEGFIESYDRVRSRATLGGTTTVPEILAAEQAFMARVCPYEFTDKMNERAFHDMLSSAPPCPLDDPGLGLVRVFMICLKLQRWSDQYPEKWEDTRNTLDNMDDDGVIVRRMIMGLTEDSSDSTTRISTSSVNKVRRLLCTRRSRCSYERIG